jgi:endoglucanase
MLRRHFVRDLAISGAAANSCPQAVVGVEEDVTPRHIPRWRASIVRAAWAALRGPAHEEFEFATIAEWGFDVVLNLNLHRIPLPHQTRRELEPADLFSGGKAERDRALDAAVLRWKIFARRYGGIPSRRPRFDLINELDSGRGNVADEGRTFDRKMLELLHRH